MAAGWRWFLYVAAMGALALPAYVVWSSSDGASGYSMRLDERWGLVMCGFMVLVFGLGALEARHQRITMGPREIEVRANLTTRRARYEDLAGRRLKREGREHYPVIEVRGGQPLKIPSTLALDVRFRRWFDALPDLDGDGAT